MWNYGNRNVVLEFKTETRILIVYFTAESGNTERVANYISSKVGGDIVKIEAAQPYTSQELNYNIQNNRPETIRKSAEGSLRRLGVERIDLYYQHRIDPKVPAEEVAGVMSELIKEGKIAHWGVSEADEEYLRKAHAVCPIMAIQNRYSMMFREYEKLFPVLEELNIGFVAFSPLANGFLSTQYNAETKFETSKDYRGEMPQFQKEAYEQNDAFVQLLKSIAAERNATTAQISLAWLIGKKPYIVPIPGTTKTERMKENADAAKIELSQDEIRKIDGILNCIEMSACLADTTGE